MVGGEATLSNPVEEKTWDHVGGEGNIRINTTSEKGSGSNPGVGSAKVKRGEEACYHVQHLRYWN